MVTPFSVFSEPTSRASPESSSPSRARRRVSKSLLSSCRGNLRKRLPIRVRSGDSDNALDNQTRSGVSYASLVPLSCPAVIASLESFKSPRFFPASFPISSSICLTSLSV